MNPADCLPVPARCTRRLHGRSAEKFFSIWNFFLIYYHWKF